MKICMGVLCGENILITGIFREIDNNIGIRNHILITDI